MSKGTVEERLEIRELIETFAVGVMRLDTELWGSTWAEDGAWKLPSLTEAVRGRDVIVETFKEKTAYVDAMSMICFPHALEFDGDTARGQCYCRELIFTKEGDQKILIGCFEDEFVRRDGRWLFASRTYEVMGLR